MVMNRDAKAAHSLRMQQQRLIRLIEEMEEIQRRIGQAARNLRLDEATLVSFDLDFHRIFASLAGMSEMLRVLINVAEEALPDPTDRPTGS